MAEIRKRTAFGILVSTFSEARRAARQSGEEKLWERNKLDNPTKRDGYEVRETLVNLPNGTTVITQQLWKKVDELRVTISAEVKVEED